MTTPASVLIEVYKQRNRSKTARANNPPGTGHTRHRLRWRAKAGNNEKVANGGAAYINLGDLLDELDRLWPGPSGAHVQVSYNGTTVPLAQSRTLLD